MITLTLEKDDVAALMGLLDAGLRSTGIRAAQDAGRLAAIIEKAVTDAEKAPAAPAKEDAQ